MSTTSLSKRTSVKSNTTTKSSLSQPPAPAKSSDSTNSDVEMSIAPPLPSTPAPPLPTQTPVSQTAAGAQPAALPSPSPPSAKAQPPPSAPIVPATTSTSSSPFDMLSHLLSGTAPPAPAPAPSTPPAKDKPVPMISSAPVHSTAAADQPPTDSQLRAKTPLPVQEAVPPPSSPQPAPAMTRAPAPANPSNAAPSNPTAPTQPPSTQPSPAAAKTSVPANQAPAPAAPPTIGSVSRVFTARTLAQQIAALQSLVDCVGHSQDSCAPDIFSACAIYSSDVIGQLGTAQTIEVLGKWKAAVLSEAYKDLPLRDLFFSLAALMVVALQHAAPAKSAQLISAYAKLSVNEALQQKELAALSSAIVAAWRKTAEQQCSIGINGLSGDVTVNWDNFFAPAASAQFVLQ